MASISASSRAWRRAAGARRSAGSGRRASAHASSASPSAGSTRTAPAARHRPGAGWRGARSTAVGQQRRQHQRAQDRQRDGQVMSDPCAGRLVRRRHHAASAMPTRRVHVHRDDARHALLLHRHADQLLGHFHRDLVVADEEELRALAHLADQLAVALGVGVVQRRVDLVEQAERRRVELEDGEHQRDRGQRLLAARQQVDGAVLLARRLRHHLHAGIEDLVAGHHQPRAAAAEQARGTCGRNVR